MYHEGSNMNILGTNMCCYCTDVLKKRYKSVSSSFSESVEQNCLHFMF